MYNKFSINHHYKVLEETFQDSKIYYVDNFFQYPDELVSYLLTVEQPKLWKEYDTPSYNGINFLYYRHSFKDKNVEIVGDTLASICGQHYTGINRDVVVTNCTKF